MAMSLNGMIARDDDREDFLSDEGWKYFVGLAREHGNFVIGRRTLEVVRENYEEGFDQLENLEKVVVSANKDYNLGEGYNLVCSPNEALDYLKAKNYSSALLTGGAKLNSSFAKAGLIDEIILNIEPVVIGSGKRLFEAEKFELAVELIDTQKFGAGGVRLRYRVIG